MLFSDNKFQKIKHPNILLLSDEERFLHSSVLFNANIPLLSCMQNGKLIKQSDQENIRPLMLACFEGSIPVVKALLAHNADPMIQTSTHGYSVLHFIAAAPLELEIKKQLFRLLITDKDILFLQDINECSVIHWLIKLDEQDLLYFLVSQYGCRARDADGMNFLFYVDSHDQDVFLYAMVHQNIEAVNLFLKDVQEEDIKFYLEKNSLKKTLKIYLSFLMQKDVLLASRFVRALKSKIRESTEDKEELDKILDRLLPALQPSYLSASIFSDERENKRQRVPVKQDDFVY
ncbi:MAG: hypothetical protein QNK11_03530 [Legionella sp.]|nr:hypothetical protein [Legionella sp.]